MIAFLTGLGAFALLAVAPGPADPAAAHAAMARRPGPALGMACGLAPGLAFWGVHAASGLGALPATSEVAPTALRLLGGALVLSLAVRRPIAAARPDGVIDPAGPTRPFRTGLMPDPASPKAVLAWVAALSVALDPSSKPGFVVAAACARAAIGPADYVGWTVPASRMRVQAAYRGARRGVDAVLGGLSGLAGTELIGQGIAR